MRARSEKEGERRGGKVRKLRGRERKTEVLLLTNRMERAPSSLRNDDGDGSRVQFVSLFLLLVRRKKKKRRVQQGGLKLSRDA